MISENELLGFKIKKMWFFEDNSNGFFIQLASLFNEGLDNFKVNCFMFLKQWFDFYQSFKSIDAENLVQELEGTVVGEL